VTICNAKLCTSNAVTVAYIHHQRDFVFCLFWNSGSIFFLGSLPPPQPLYLAETKSYMQNCTKWRVCVALFYWTDIGKSLCTVTGLRRERAKGDAPTIRDRWRPNLTLSPLRYPGVSGSSPSTLTKSLAIPVPSSSSSNGPTTTTLTTKGMCPGGSVVWAGPKFVRPHWWGSWVISGKISWDPRSQLSWNPPPPTA